MTTSTVEEIFTGTIISSSGDWHNYAVKRKRKIKEGEARGPSLGVKLSHSPNYEEGAFQPFLSFTNFVKLFLAVFNIWYYGQSMEGFFFSKTLEYFNRSAESDIYI